MTHWMLLLHAPARERHNKDPGCYIPRLEDCSCAIRLPNFAHRGLRHQATNLHIANFLDSFSICTLELRNVEDAGRRTCVRNTAKNVVIVLLDHSCLSWVQINPRTGSPLA